MDEKPIASLTHFNGLNNVDDSLRLSYKIVMTQAGHKAAYPLLTADNMDIDNLYGLSSRPGSDSKLSGSDVHSLWSDGDTCLFVDGESLYELQSDYSATSLLSGQPRGSRMSYVSINDRIYLTNKNYIGYFKNHTLNTIPVPDTKFKVSLPPGQRIAYYRGLLLVAAGPILYISDALCDHYDIRTGFRIFANDITMVRPVDDGIFVSDGNTYFLSDGENFKRDKVLDVDAIPYSDININGKDIKDGVDGNYAMWVGEDGIYVGSPNGKVNNITKDQFAMGSHGVGGSVLRSNDGINHYIAVLE